MTTSLRFPRLPLAIGVLLYPGVAPAASATQDPAPEPVLAPYLVREVRALLPAAAQLLVVNRDAPGRGIELVEVEVSVAGLVIERLPLERSLAGDPTCAEWNATLERLPEGAAHRHGVHRRHFAPPDAPQIDPREAFAVQRDLRRDLAAMRERYADPAARPFAHVDLILPYDQLFASDAPLGEVVTLTFTLRWRDARGRPRQSAVTEEVRWLGPRPGLPGSFTLGNPTVSVHAGDLHVHSCHGEAVGACPPSTDCTAESLQTSGSFSYAELRSQYEALGLDWFTATDHSYCINSDAEYAAIVAEAQAVTDASFLCVPDIELSSDEEGPQVGSDSGDILCLGLTSANHMGAHGITSRMEGGDDGLLGFCNGLFSDALEGFKANAAEIRAQGGYPVINHPAASSFAWNSFAETEGQEAGMMHGVEIWNGATRTGQGGDVAAWVQWLLAGRILYAYSGSDTHDEAFDFGANHVLVEGSVDPESLIDALRAGSVYVSNGPSLVVELSLGGSLVPMGAQHVLPTPVPNAPVTVRAHVDFGADTGTVQLYRGVVGDASETLLVTSAPISGSAVVEFSDVLVDGCSWYRAYAENQAASSAAYSNPVFLLPGAGELFTYCTAKPNSAGCTPWIAGYGTPSASAGQGFFIVAEDVISQQFGILVYAYSPAFMPFDDATLCIGFPLVRTPVQSSGGSGTGNCSGVLRYDFNARIASGVDSGLVAGATVYAQYWYRDPAVASTTGLSDALQFLIQP